MEPPLPSPPDLPPSPPKSKAKPSDSISTGERILSFVIQAIVLATAIPLFFLFAAVAAILLLHLWLAGAALRRHRSPNLNGYNSISTVMLPNSLDRAPTLSQAQLKRMPCCMWRWPWPKEQCCAVCLEKVQRGELYRSLPACAHVFHKACVDKWLLRCPNCPLCRELVRPV